MGNADSGFRRHERDRPTSTTWKEHAAKSFLVQLGDSKDPIYVAANRVSVKSFGFREGLVGS